MDTGYVTWEDENRGTRKTSLCIKTCFRPNYAIELSIKTHAQLLINAPDIWRDNGDVKLDICRDIDRNLRETEPKISSRDIGKIYEQLNELIPKALTHGILQCDMNDPTISNFAFLALLGKKRNWKEGCAICLTDKIMGTTCMCGHTEIVIFRPCGHAMCSQPCFVDFMKAKNHTIGPKHYTDSDGKTWTTLGSADVDTNIEFDCPLCTVKVTSTFRAEEVAHDNTLLDLTKLREEIVSTLPA